jgi:hypothetical protein
MGYDTDAIATAIASTLSSLASDGIGVQAVGAALSNPSPSGAYVHDGPITYDLSMQRGLDEIAMVITLLVGYNQDQAAQRRLRKLRDGSTGVKSLVEADRTLGGIVADARVTDVSAPRLYELAGGKPALGCEFTVTILATP